MNIAMRNKDASALRNVIAECVAAGLPELERDIHKCRETLDLLVGGSGQLTRPTELRDQLLEAIHEKDLTKLDKAIRDCEAAGYPELSIDLRRARYTLESLGGGRGG